MLPEIPRQRKTQEADFGLEFRKWVEKELPATAGFEHKTTSGKNYLPFAAVKPLQIGVGMKIKGKGILIRVQSGTSGAPDYIWLRKENSFIVIDYPKGFAIIDVIVFHNEAEGSIARSLTWERACDIAYKVIIRK